MANVRQWEETPLSTASRKECLRIRTIRHITIGGIVDAYDFQPISSDIKDNELSCAPEKDKDGVS